MSGFDIFNWDWQLQQNSLKSGYWSPFENFVERDENGLVTQKYITVYWDYHKENFNCCNVTVIPFDRNFLEDKYVQAMWSKYDTFKCVDGSCSAGWNSSNTNPTGLFCYLSARYKFTDEFEYYRAILEFAQIKECQWARDMLKSPRFQIQNRLIYLTDNQTEFFVNSLQSNYFSWWVEKWQRGYSIDQILRTNI